MASRRIRSAGWAGHALLNANPWVDGRKRSALAGSGTTLALVHGLYPRDRDGVPPPEELGAGPRRGRHLLLPRVTVPEQIRCGADGEVARGDPVEVLPGDRERHRGARADARAVGGDPRRPAGPRR